VTIASNTGAITGVAIAISFQDAAKTVNLDNAGNITGGQGITADIGNINNSGTITGREAAININAANVTNTGLLQATGNSDAGLVASTADLTNTGTIIGTTGIFAASTTAPARTCRCSARPRAW
jgi:hypothetical protein